MKTGSLGCLGSLGGNAQRPRAAVDWEPRAAAKRDAKGKEEKANMQILLQNRPRCFRAKPKWENDMIMRCRERGSVDEQLPTGRRIGSRSIPIFECCFGIAQAACGRIPSGLMM